MHLQHFGRPAFSPGDAAQVFGDRARGNVITFRPSAIAPGSYTGQLDDVVLIRHRASAWGISPAPIGIDELGRPIYDPTDVSVFGPDHPINRQPPRKPVGTTRPIVLHPHARPNQVPPPRGYKCAAALIGLDVFCDLYRTNVMMQRDPNATDMMFGPLVAYYGWLSLENLFPSEQQRHNWEDLKDEVAWAWGIEREGPECEPGEIWIQQYRKPEQWWDRPVGALVETGRFFQWVGYSANQVTGGFVPGLRDCPPGWTDRPFGVLR